LYLVHRPRAGRILLVMLREECPVSIALSVVAGKWKPLFLRELKSGSIRYGQLLRRIPEATQKVLTSQLRQLERDGLVERTVFHDATLRTQYALTAYGRTLRPALEELARWGRRHGKRANLPTRSLSRRAPVNS
jgi:DNA-binding HxlR family transcriptional regulator